MEKYMLVPEKVETIEIVQDGKVVATIEPGEQEEKRDDGGGCYGAICGADVLRVCDREILRDRGERRAGRVSVRAGGAGARVLPLFHAGKSEKQLARVGFA